MDIMVPYMLYRLTIGIILSYMKVKTILLILMIIITNILGVFEN